MLHGKYNSIQYSHIPAGYLQVGLLLTVVAIALDVFLKCKRLPKQDSSGAAPTRAELVKRLVFSLRPSMLFWTIPGFAALVALRTWCDMGLYSGKAGPVTTCCNWALVSIIIPLVTAGSSEWWPLLKSFVLSNVSRLISLKQKHANPSVEQEPRARHFRLPSRHDFLRGALAVSLILAIAVLADCALEISWNDTFNLFGVSYFAIEVTLVGLAILVAYFLCLRHGGGVALVVAAYYTYVTISFINYMPRAAFVVKAAIEEAKAQASLEPSERGQGRPQVREACLTEEPDEGTTTADGLDHVREAVDRWVADKRYLESDVSIDEIARQMGISRQELNDYFAKVLQLPFRSWRIEQRIREAERILAADPAITTSELYARCGYNDRSNFHKHFTKVTGRSLADYREEA